MCSTRLLAVALSLCLGGYASAQCTATPAASCRQTVVAGASFIKMRHGNKDSLAWKWLGQATTLADFGNPTATTNYHLCIYMGAGSVVDNAADAGGNWVATARGYEYELEDALGRKARYALRPGADGRARIKVKGRLFLTPLNGGILVPLPLAVQLQSSDGPCWEAVYSTATHNDYGYYFFARSD